MSVAEPHPFASSATPLLETVDVSFAYGERRILDRVSMTVYQREFVALTGANGSGKSTLIRIALGLLRPHAGAVLLFGTDVCDLGDRGRLGYVPQRPQVDLELPATVEEIVSTGRLACRQWWRRPRPDDRDAVDHALSIAGLNDLVSSRVDKLSGGQLQRVFIARALASMPQLLVLDEPTTGVDAQAHARFREALVHHVRVHVGAVLLVTHELEPVAADVDRVLVLKDGQLA